MEEGETHMNVQEEAEAKMEREAQIKKENAILTAGKTPLSSANATVGAEIVVNTKAFSVKYEKATITEIKPGIRGGAIVKFISATGSKNQLTARPVAEKGSQGSYQAYLA